MNFQQNNPIFQQMFGGYEQFQQQFQSFMNNMQSQVPNPASMDPMKMVQDMIQNGKISPQEFEMYRQQANMMTGMNK